MNIMHTAFFLLFFFLSKLRFGEIHACELLLCAQKMAGFCRIAPVLEDAETMNSHPHDGLEARRRETALKTHRRWLLLFFFP